MNAFTILKRAPLQDYQGEGVLYEHKPTGARLLYISCPDEDCAFAVSFRTLPEQSHGVAHILEHSVLCGSKRFPVKEPFADLMRTSLATFLNAMTYPDRTIYPVSSRNPQDLRNLFEVYFDAVFHPLIYQDPLILLQEGWHYEFNEQGELIRNGVVYNEMRGALSDPIEALQTEVQKHLYASTIYSVCSGGDPKEIPSLTQEAFLEFHRKYYHPSNACFFLYGNLDIESYLTRLTELLQDYQRQPAFSVPNYACTPVQPSTLSIPVPASSSNEDRCVLMSCQTLDRRKNDEIHLLQFLCNALAYDEISPLKRALLEDPELQIGDVNLYLRTDVTPACLECLITGARGSSYQLLESKILQALEKIVKTGFDRSYLDALFANMRFNLLEYNHNQPYRGIHAGLRALNTWPEGGNPLEELQLSESMERLHQTLSSEKLCQCIQNYWLNNPSRIYAWTEPDPELAHKRLIEERKQLQNLQAQLSPEEQKEIRQTSQALLIRQQTPDSPQKRATLPSLRKTDLPSSPPTPLLHRDANGWLYTETPTAGILYHRLEFDVSDIEDRYALGLLSVCLSRFPTQRKKELPLKLAMLEHIGQFHPHLQVQGERLYLEIDVNWLETQTPEALSLLQELLTQTEFQDPLRLRRILLEQAVRLETQFTQSGHRLVAQRILAQMHPAHLAYEEAAGLHWLDALNQSLRPEGSEKELVQLCDRIQKVARLVFCQKRLLCHTACEYPQHEAERPALDAFVAALPEGETTGTLTESALSQRCEGITLQSEVQYVGQGVNYKQSGLPWDGRLLLLQNLLSQGYLWDRVRVTGGAYGVFLQVRPSGDLIASSYRDPELEQTWSIYDTLPDAVSTLTLTQEDLDGLILGTWTVFQPVLPIFSQALLVLQREREGVDVKQWENSWKQILECKPEDLPSLADYFLPLRNNPYRCCAGSEAALNQARNRFDALRSLKNET